MGTPFQLKHILGVRFFLVLALLGTLLFYAFNPRYLHNKEFFDTHLNVADYKLRDFVLIPTYAHPIAVYLTSGIHGLKLHIYDMKTGFKPEMTLSDLEGDVYSYWDDEDGAIYLIQRKINTWRYELVRIHVNEDLSFDYDVYSLFDNPTFAELRDTTVTVNDELFLPPRFTGNAFSVQQETGALRLYFTEAESDTLSQIDPRNLDECAIVKRIAARLQEVTGKPFNLADVYRIIQTFKRNVWYKTQYLDRNAEMYSNYGTCFIVGRPDCNGDGEREFLILLRGDRYLNNTIVCWDQASQSILWRRDISSFPRVDFIADIDGDRCDEVGISTDAQGTPLGVDWSEHPEVGTTNESVFCLLDNDGNFYPWSKKRDYIVMGGLGTQTIAHYFPKQNAIILCSQTNMDPREKHLLQLDLSDGSVDTLDVPYINISASFWLNGQLHLWDKLPDELREYRFSENMELVSTKIEECNYTPHIHGCSPVYVENKPYLVSAPFSILDEDMQVCYRQSSINATSVQARADTLYFIDAGKDQTGYLCWLSLKRNHQLNPVAPLLVGFELLLLLIYWAVHTFVMSPIASGENGYIVLWNLFGRLFIWQPLGRASIYRLPRYLAFDKRYFTAAIQGLSSEFSCVYERRLLFVRFCLYELEKVDELAVVQHVAHELKNRLHVARLSLDEDDEAARIALRESLRWSYNAARTISDFSRVSALAPKPTDLRDVIDDTMMSLSGHPRADCIQTRIPTESVDISADSRLLGMALRNVLENALQAIHDDESVHLTLERQADEAVLTVSNPGNLPHETIEKILAGGWSSKPDGSGVGVSVARIIVQNHKGRFHFMSQDGQVSVVITLPSVMETS